MKIISSVLTLIALTVSLHADHVHDNAKLLGDKASALESKLSSSHVYVATFDDNPKPDIESYSKEALNKINAGNSFLVVVVKNSHQWRITMHPSGLVSPNLTKVIGDGMVSGLKRGDFYNAFADASASLEPLALSPPTVNKTVTTTTHTSTVTPTRAVVVQREPFYPLIVLGIVIGVIFCIWLFFAFCDWMATPREVHHHYTTGQRSSTSQPDLNAEQRAEAQRVYSTYSPAQRQQMCMMHPGYGGYYNDPFQFYCMMTMMNMMSNHNSGYYQTQYADYAHAQPIETTTTDRTETTYQESTPAGSDSSGSGGSWSSEPSPSYSSPSSSDSSSGSSSDSGSSWGSSDSGSSSGGDSGGSSDSSSGSW